MKHLVPPDYSYCPKCRGLLHVRVEEEHIQRKYCRDCVFVYYPTVPTSVIAVVIRGDLMAMVRRGREPFLGSWMFPSGFLEYGEHPREGLPRELEEETGLQLVFARPLFDEPLQEERDDRCPGHLDFPYLVDASGTLLNKDSKENLAVEWIKIGSHIDLAGFSSQIKVLDWIEKSRR